MRILEKLKYQQLINLAKADNGTIVRIIRTNKGKIVEIREFLLSPDNLISKGKKFYAQMHRVIIKAIEENIGIEIIYD